MPSSDQIDCTFGTPRSRSRASMAIAHGACTRPPNGVRMQARQSPSSSRNRSIVIVWSLVDFVRILTGRAHPHLNGLRGRVAVHTTEHLFDLHEVKRGVGSGLVYGLTELAGLVGMPLIWGEATAYSAPFYAKALAVREITDHFFIEGAVLAHCRRKFQEEFLGQT